MSVATPANWCMHLPRDQARTSPAPAPKGVATDLPRLESRFVYIERDLVLPVKAVMLGILFYYMFLSNWMSDVGLLRDMVPLEGSRRFAGQVVQSAFLVYVAMNVGVAFILLGLQKIPRHVVERAVFSLALVDGLFLAGLIVVTGGVNSTLYWLYPVLILRNSISLSPPLAQVILNVFMCLFFGAAGLLDITITELDLRELELARVGGVDSLPDEGTVLLFKPLLLKMVLLICVGMWCYVMQVLLQRKRASADEQRELQLRGEQLQASGRLAAEIAHQLKNPLSIINNAAFTLQRTLKEGKTITQQIRIIREEVDRSDRLITELMGYAQLVEGRVERLNVREELERALLEVFPPAVKYETKLHRDFAVALPQLLAQRGHIAEVFVNIMQNAREALQGAGNLWVSATHGEDQSVVIAIRDDGPGIAPEHLARVFDPYFSTRERGTGLGLAIVKHNTELYGGKVRVESELGQGTQFVLQFPARTLLKLSS